MASVLYNAQRFIDEAQSVGELTEFLKRIPLQRIKDTIRSELDNMEQSEAETICIAASPLDCILSNDVIQSVLSYLPFQKSLRWISHNFNVLHSESRRLSMKETVNHTDWSAVIQSKWSEIRTLNQQWNREQYRVNDKYRELISMNERILEQLLKEHKEIDENTDSDSENVSGYHSPSGMYGKVISFCRGCNKLQQCQDSLYLCDDPQCKVSMCGQCMNRCEGFDCPVVYCRECCSSSTRFWTSMTMQKLCKQCYDDYLDERWQCDSENSENWS